MKSVIIAGATRTGKTTLTRHLHNEIGGSIIAGDMLVKAFSSTYPELEILHGIYPVEKTSSALLAFLATWLDLNANNSYRRFILDIYHLLPSSAQETGMTSKYKVLFFGYPDIDPEEKLANIRKFMNQIDWTRNIPDEELLTLINHQIAWSQRIQKECAENDIPFINMSANFQTTLDNTLHNLITELKA